MPDKEQKDLSAMQNSHQQQTELTWPALLVVLVISGLVAAMFWSTGGYLTQAHMILLYVGVAIITGILFWHLTPGATAQFDVKQLGIRLGGALR